MRVNALFILFLLSICSSVQAEDVCASAANIPNIKGADYLKARSILLNSGWKPIRTLLTVKNQENSSVAGDLIDAGVVEVAGCREASKECYFTFRDKAGNFLGVNASGFNFPVSRTILACMDKKDWVNKAAVITKAILDANTKDLSNKILGLTHPTGQSPVIVGSEIAKYDDRITAEITTEWKGGFSGTPYKTVIAWTLNKSGPVSVIVKSDTAMYAVSPENLVKLNGFFETEMSRLAKQATEEF